MERHQTGIAQRDVTPHDPAFLHDLVSDVRLAPLWLAIRVALGWFWLEAGWRRLQESPWTAGQQVAGGGVGDALAIGLTLAGIALILGFLVGPAAFVGGCLSAGFWTAGGLLLAIFQFAAVVWLILAWKTAGWLGLDRWLLPLLGFPWRSGALVGRERPLDLEGSGTDGKAAA